jgi:glycosyltransferase involved in cell wall biosynthesis
LASNVGLRRQLNIKAEDRVLLFLGNLEPRKNPLMLLDTVKNLLDRGQKVKLVLCGKGPLLSKLQTKINQLGLGNFVVLTGTISEESKPEYYNMADVFVFPSELEGFGLVLAEAMSCGKPVVSFDNSSIPEVVEDGVTGFLVKTGDKDEFVKKTLLLLEEEHLRRRMACQAVERVERMFRWERAARETLSIYIKALEKFKLKLKKEQE